MLEEIDATQWHGWIEFWNVEPWGDLRADQRAAAQALWNTAPYAGANSKLPDLTFPYFKDPEKEIADTVATLKKRRDEWLSQSQNSQST